MQIGKKGAASTSISTADADSLTVRGHDLTSDLMGRVGFTEYFYLLMTGDEASEDQVFFLDLLLVAIAEHGLVPTNQVARMTYAAAPESLQGAVAAGILGCGSVILGAAESCGVLLNSLQDQIDLDDGTRDQVINDALLEIRGNKQHLPGFGHPLHKPLDPRTQRILELSRERNPNGKFTALARDLEREVPNVWNKPLPMNVSMAIAAVLLDLGFPHRMLKAIPILARTASLLAHLGEEADKPIGFYMAGQAEAAIKYEPDADK